MSFIKKVKFFSYFLYLNDNAMLKANRVKRAVVNELNGFFIMLIL